MDDQTMHETLLAVVEQIVSACSDARERGEEIPDWLDEIDDNAIEALSAVTKEAGQ